MSYVYILKCNTSYKIGVAKSVEERIKTLQTGNSQLIEEIYRVHVGSTAYSVENKLHKMYNHCRLEGEWFALCADEVNTIITLLKIEQYELQHNSTNIATFMFDLGSVLNQAEQAIVKFLVTSYTLEETIDSNVIEPTKCSTYTRYLAKAFEKNYKNLCNQKVLVRLQRGRYLINPIILGITSTKVYKHFQDTIAQAV